VSKERSHAFRKTCFIKRRSLDRRAWRFIGAGSTAERWNDTWWIAICWPVCTLPNEGGPGQAGPDTGGPGGSAAGGEPGSPKKEMKENPTAQEQDGPSSREQEGKSAGKSTDHEGKAAAEGKTGPGGGKAEAEGKSGTTGGGRAEAERKGGTSTRLQSQQVSKVKTYFAEPRPSVQRIEKSQVSVSIGVALPSTVVLYDLPPDIIVVEGTCPVKYFVWGDDVVLVDSCTRHVLEIIGGIA
jgi:Protein of unknown function (DUF1236)